ncbi:unnamed protein product [Rotaria sp. Silwood2]|nr:unnamed protein product [Rotaria sp. Silwood2]CAF2712497.1 unnamed protein product [Rotaria sp. Silwood2]CAF3060199.1 unnamed protein product [Rotaria sp. Silwood2]CAF4330423.1 unnamed protein product [Rotaria sp. Silwood2]CAF4336924.1 unnamed protein product [Rotaria sp. Silwood2]
MVLINSLIVVSKTMTVLNETTSTKPMETTRKSIISNSCSGVVTITCYSSSQCGSKGQCNSSTYTCECSKDYTTGNRTAPCEYEQK